MSQIAGSPEGFESPEICEPARSVGGFVEDVEAATAGKGIWKLGGGARRDHTEAELLLQQIDAASPKKRSRVAAKASLEHIQAAALHHSDPFVRRRCLEILDHHANEASTLVFARALHDPVEFVRHTALHSIACETCRTEPLCVSDVVPHLVQVLAGDPSPEVRHKAIPVLLRLAEHDPRGRWAVECSADQDNDAVVRDVARRALLGQHVRGRRAYLRRARRTRTSR